MPSSPDVGPATASPISTTEYTELATIVGTEETFTEIATAWEEGTSTKGLEEYGGSFFDLFNMQNFLIQSENCQYEHREHSTQLRETGKSLLLCLCRTYDQAYIQRKWDQHLKKGGNSFIMDLLVVYYCGNKYINYFTRNKCSKILLCLNKLCIQIFVILKEYG